MNDPTNPPRNPPAPLPEIPPGDLRFTIYDLPFPVLHSYNEQMIAQAHSATLLGIEALPIVIEVDLRNFTGGEGEPAFIMVGLADKAVEESRVRVKQAISNSDLGYF